MTIMASFVKAYTVAELCIRHLKGYLSAAVAFSRYLSPSITPRNGCLIAETSYARIALVSSFFDIFAWSTSVRDGESFRAW